MNGARTKIENNTLIWISRQYVIIWRLFINSEINSKDNNKNKTIYFMGIGGTGIEAVVGFCKEAGFKVLGSDK